MTAKPCSDAALQAASEPIYLRVISTMRLAKIMKVIIRCRGEILETVLIFQIAL
jgi:hypothetical protein